MSDYVDLPDWVKDHLQHLKQQVAALNENKKLYAKVNRGLEKKVASLEEDNRKLSKMLYLLWLKKGETIKIPKSVWQIVPNSLILGFSDNVDVLSVSLTDLGDGKTSP